MGEGKSADKCQAEEISKLAQSIYRETAIHAIAHAYAAESWGGRHLALGLTITVVSAVVSASIFTEYAALTVAGAVLSLILVVISAVATFLNPDQRTTSHMKAKTCYEGLADRARALYRVDLVLKNESIENLCATYEEMLEDLDEIRRNCPRLPMRHLDRAIREMDAIQAKKEAQ